MTYRPEQFGLTQAEVNEFEKKERELEAFLRDARAASEPEFCENCGFSVVSCNCGENG